MSNVNSGKTAGSFHSECPQNHVISNQMFASAVSTGLQVNHPRQQNICSQVYYAWSLVFKNVSKIP